MKKMCGILLLMATFYTTLEAVSQIKRYQVGEKETRRYLERTNAGDHYICHYKGSGFYEVSLNCLNKNKNQTGKQAFFFPGTGAFPACPPLPDIINGYWICPREVFPKSVEVYASCAARCSPGFKLMQEKVIRCPESLVWEHLADIHCISENDSCSIWSVNNITSTPFEVSITWNASLACEDANFTLLMRGPSQNFTKQLQKNSNFIVIKNIQPDVEYEVSLYLKEELLISGKLRSAAVVCPQRPVNVHVHTLNTTAVNITWAATGNDRFITGYMVNITCDDNWVTQNTTENAVMLSLLETGRNYTISVKAYNQYCLGLDSGPVFFKLPEKEEDLPEVTDSPWVVILVISLTVVLLPVVCFCVWKTKRLKTATSKGIERGDCSGIEMHDSTNTSNTEARVANNTESPNCTTALLSASSRALYPSTDSTSDITELESASGPDALHAASTNNDLKSCVEQLNQVNVKERNGHQKRAPGSDSGRGSETETDCTGSDCDKFRSSQSSEKSLQEEICEGNDCKHQNPSASADSVNDCKHQNPTASANSVNDCKHQNPTASADSVNDCKHQNPTASADSVNDCKHQNPTALANSVNDCKHQNPTASADSVNDCKHQNPTASANSVNDCKHQNPTASADSVNDCKHQNPSVSVDHVNDCKHQNPSASADSVNDCKHQNPSVSADSVNDCKHQNPSVSADSVNDKGKLNEANLHLEKGLNDAENCTCTISEFLNLPYTLEYIERLADLLDPHEHYTDQKSWKGLAANVLHLEHTKIIAIGHRSRNAFQDEILDYLTSQGKTLGHLVYYFSRKNTNREDVIKLIGEIHSECPFCDKFFGSQQPS